MLLLPLVHFYRKSARDTPKIEGIASTFAMFLHSMPDQVGHDVVVCLDVIAGLTGKLSDYHSSKSNTLIINKLTFGVGKLLIPIYLYLYLNT